MCFLAFSTMTHGAVGQIAHALPRFLAFAHDGKRQLFARQKNGTNGVGKVVDV